VVSDLEDDLPRVFHQAAGFVLPPPVRAPGRPGDGGERRSAAAGSVVATSKGLILFITHYTPVL
jgi:hypothetical protein